MKNVLMDVESTRPMDTFKFGEILGGKAKPGMVVCLSGDLGTGKTVFAKGFGRGLGITEPVVSPTFTIVSEYREGRLPLFHFDTYRIEDPDEMYEVGLDEYLYGEGVCLIEWPEMIEDLLTDEYLLVTIEKNPEKGEDYRKITLYEVRK